MRHSVKYIGEDLEKLSVLRNDKNYFNAQKFFSFAKENQSKYSIVEIKDDLFVNSWNSNSLIDDFKHSLNKLS